MIDVAKSGGAIAGFILLAACQTAGTDGVLSNALPGQEQNKPTAQPGKNPNAIGRQANTRLVLADYCPAVRIRTGTESFRLYKGNDRENDDNVRYQVSITKVARECRYVGQNLEIKVGARGRIITGPAGGAGTVKMPIRVAVQQGDCSRHFKLHQHSASVPSGSTNSSFEFVDDTIVMPAPTATNVRIYLGFDETPNARSSSQTCA